ncbi:ParB/RepB/Spo0J family partition protein [Pannonibacter carbonis]|uniref:ParB/RepB/Spo0J family partition protein n=1 Tax=Pannonibacter carbonis TaxID=2067569 RepID=UPI000D0EED72|nr:ParB N-terminal domain-containing protein [Pannonibacter carbonis]
MNVVNWINSVISDGEKLSILDNGRPEAPPYTERQAVSAELIFVYPEVFQPRPEGIDTRHMHDLKSGLSRGNPEDMDPILVFPYERPEVGCHFVVVDGHHRLAALLELGIDSVPVKVFAGTASEAQVASIYENSKGKKSLSPSERTEAAWRLCKQRSSDGTWLHSKSDIVASTLVSESTVAKMRRVIREDEHHGNTDGLSWIDVKRMDARTGQNLSEDELDDIAREIAYKIPEHVIKRFHKNPDMCARALVIVMGNRSEDLLLNLLGHVEISEGGREAIQEMLEDEDLGAGYYGYRANEDDDADY